MKLVLFVLLSVSVLGSFPCLPAQENTRVVSLCLLQDHPEGFLYSTVEVEGLVFAGVEYPRIISEKCSLRFAFGDDYQTFGERFPVRFDEQWTQMKKLLDTTECASNVRAAKARIRGTIIQVPATGNTLQMRCPLNWLFNQFRELSMRPRTALPQTLMLRVRQFTSLATPSRQSRNESISRRDIAMMPSATCTSTVCFSASRSTGKERDTESGNDYFD